MVQKSFLRLYGFIAAVGLLLLALQLLPHRIPRFVPDYARADLTALLAADSLTRADYDLLLRQTGLGQAGIDACRTANRTDLILSAQAAFFQPAPARCDPLAPITWEDRLSGAGFPIIPVQDGDVLLSFSTHSLGWRHGHAGVVVDAAQGLTLEAVVLGSDSTLVDLTHWSQYTTFLHLRLRGISPAEQQQIAAMAKDRLSGIPYRLLSGLTGEKYGSAGKGASGAQCAYLVWYALMSAGYDTDGDGGRLVTVADLAQSPLFEIVQVYGLDPTALSRPFS